MGQCGIRAYISQIDRTSDMISNSDSIALDDHLLKDIGIGRAEAERLAAKPFDWREVPAKMIR
jgi:hypothetical protein